MKLDRTHLLLTILSLAASGCLHAQRSTGFVGHDANPYSFPRSVSTKGLAARVRLAPVAWQPRAAPSTVTTSPLSLAVRPGAWLPWSTAVGPVAPSAAALPFAVSIPAPRALRCARVQVGPGKWITPLCRPLPAVWVRRFDRRNHLDASLLPPSVDLRTRGLDGPVKDQQQVGVCWSFALSSVMDNAARKLGRRPSITPLHLIARDAWSQMWAQVV